MGDMLTITARMMMKHTTKRRIFIQRPFPIRTTSSRIKFAEEMG